jgi:hypothetical protein
MLDDKAFLIASESAYPAVVVLKTLNEHGPIEWIEHAAQRAAGSRRSQWLPTRWHL